jgi:tRNA-2-methylthio-N6-dimethylallyladenosine synthase
LILESHQPGKGAGKTPLSKKLFIKTYGCQMNVYDSGRMADLLAPLGFGVTPDIAQADMVILNTCHIRERASEKVYSELGRLKLLRAQRQAQGSDTIIAVAGCVAQAEGEEMLRRAPDVDIVLGPQAYHRLPEMVAQAARAGARRAGKTRGIGILDTEFPAESKFDFLPEPSAACGVSAFLSIQEGCDKFCTFCVVPYTRGAEYSRPVAKIEAEARRLVETGAREITLLGQNVNAYHGIGPDGGDWRLGRLIRHLAERIEGLARIRYTTSHPTDMDEDLIAAHAEVPALMPFLHLPVQSGSDRLLEAMNRRHRVDDFLDIVDRLRSRREDLALSSDFIVGFPGESDDDFDATMKLIERVGFAQAFSFCYSARPGTPAATMPDQVPSALAEARLQALQSLLERQQRAYNAAMVGKTLPVLIEKNGRRAGQLVGKSPYLQAVHADLPSTCIGEVVAVKIVGVGRFSLEGWAAPRRLDPGEVAA